MNNNVKTIALSANTDTLINCTKILNEIFEEICRVHEEEYGYVQTFEEAASKAFYDMNNIIKELLTNEILDNLIESKYTMI